MIAPTKLSIINIMVITIEKPKSAITISPFINDILLDARRIGLYSCNFGTMLIKNSKATTHSTNNKQAAKEPYEALVPHRVLF